MANRSLITRTYSDRFSQASAASDYRRKLSRGVERLRHSIELDILAKSARGDLFDCSIATGRFVGRLPHVQSYAGMDYSMEFLSFVAAEFPEVSTNHGDLHDGIAQPDNRFDTVLCLRTLSSLQIATAVVPEMARITRSGGRVIFDYGSRPQRLVLKGEEVTVDSENIPRLLSSLSLSGYKRIALDGLLNRLKWSSLLYRGANRLIDQPLGASVLLSAEKLAGSLMPQRYLYIVDIP